MKPEHKKAAEDYALRKDPFSIIGAQFRQLMKEDFLAGIAHLSPKLEAAEARVKMLENLVEDLKTKKGNYGYENK